jgi:hypothetical protein
MPSLPAVPVRNYSFTGLSTTNPTAQQPGVNLDANYDLTNAAVGQLITFLQVSLNADGTLSSAAVEAAYAAGETNSYEGANVADAPSALSALLAQAWAEYMPGELPASTLAVTGITGDHWSARWWANQAVLTVSLLQSTVSTLSAEVLALLQSPTGTQPSYAGIGSYFAALPSTAQTGLWNDGGLVSQGTVIQPTFQDVILPGTTSLVSRLATDATSITANATAITGINTSITGINTSITGINTTTAATNTAIIALPGVANTIAILRAATSTTLKQSTCAVLGYTSVLDGAGGVFSVRPGDTTSADNGGTIIVDASARRWGLVGFTDRVSVLQFGAKGTGLSADLANDNAAFANAIAAMSALGGGTVTVPRRAFLIDPFYIPSHVTVEGETEGPFDGGANPATTVGAPTLLVNSTATPFITLNGWASSITDVLIYYPGQVAPTAAAPNVYPPTISALGGGSAVRRCTIVNSYIGIFVATGRVYVDNNRIGSYKTAIQIDHAEDYVMVRGNQIEPFYNIFLALSTPQTIDAWVLSNGVGIEVSRADGFAASDNGIFVKYAGIILNDTPTAGVSPTNGYGKFSNTDIDSCVYGVLANSSNNSGGGYQFTNLNVGGNPYGIGTASQAAMALNPGGNSPPMVTWSGGAQRHSTGGWAAGQTGVALNAGFCNITNVGGVNNVGLLTAPAMPVSNSAVANPFPFAVRLFVNPGSGTTIATITISGTPVAVTATGGSTAPFNFTLDAGESVSLNYTGTPTWQWFPDK